MGGANKNCKKKNYLSKNLLSPMFFKIKTSKFQEMFYDIFRKFCWKEVYYKLPSNYISINYRKIL